MDKKLLRKSDKKVLAEKCFFAVTPFQRFWGMMGRKFASAAFDAMVFERCNAIHCCWMREAIDVLFVSADLEVVKVCHRVRPWRLAWGGKKAAVTIELPAGTLEACKVNAGELLEFEQIQIPYSVVTGYRV